MQVTGAVISDCSVISDQSVIVPQSSQTNGLVVSTSADSEATVCPQTGGG